MTEPTPDRSAENRNPADNSTKESPNGPPFRVVDPWAVVSYLLGGVILYGGIGWLIDLWLGTRGFVAAGIVLGAAAAVWLVWLRYGKP